MDLCAGTVLRTHCGRQQDCEIESSRRVATMKSALRNPEKAGIGLRLAHLAEMVATRPPTAWLEIHPENFLANPHAAELLSELSAHYAISLHTVGISVGRLSIHRRNYQK